ncbi:hypothetical protein CSC12_2740 [Klebsiella michiganensis]|nr:hypothetical protein CSC12_2740 [Klebsiella michiganensis]
MTKKGPSFIFINRGMHNFSQRCPQRFNAAESVLAFYTQGQSFTFNVT